QVALVVQLAEVAGLEEAVLGEDLLRGSLVVPVAAEDLPALDLNLAVLGDADRGAGQRRADRSGLRVRVWVNRHRRRGLGKAVALKHEQAHAAEEVGEAGTERGAAGDRGLGAAAERRP